MTVKSKSSNTKNLNYLVSELVSKKKINTIQNHVNHQNHPNHLNHLKYLNHQKHLNHLYILKNII